MAIRLPAIPRPSTKVLSFRTWGHTQIIYNEEVLHPQLNTFQSELQSSCICEYIASGGVDTLQKHLSLDLLYHPLCLYKVNRQGNPHNDIMGSMALSQTTNRSLVFLVNSLHGTSPRSCIF